MSDDRYSSADGVFHEGGPINMLQNDIIPLFFKIWKKMKNRRHNFVGNLILNTSCDFHYDDVTVTNIIDSHTTVESIWQGTAFCYSFRCGQKESLEALMPITMRSIQCKDTATCFTRPAIHVWCKKFAHGWGSVDEERPGHATSKQQPALFYQAFMSLLIHRINP